MTIELNPDVLRAAYNYLNETDPFRKWNLPDGEDVVFKVIKKKDVWGYYYFQDNKHHIEVSSSIVGRTSSLMYTMAHEMVHLHEQNITAITRAEHSKAFRKWLAQVCRVHEDFDPKIDHQVIEV